MVSVLKKH